MEDTKRITDPIEIEKEAKKANMNMASFINLQNKKLDVRNMIYQELQRQNPELPNITTGVTTKALEDLMNKYKKDEANREQNLQRGFQQI